MERGKQYSQRPKDVYFYATCLVDLFCPEAGMDAITLLEREGVTVHFPEDQTCCGQPAYTSGFADEARAVALTQMRLFPEDWPVVIPSGSCAGIIRHHYPKLFADDPELKARAEDLAERVFELSEFLLTVLKVQWKDAGKPTTVTLHTSCAARREMGTHEHTRALLAQLPNVNVALQEHESECCGFGGTFSLKHPSISSAMAGDKADALKGTGAEGFISADCGCMMNINTTLKKRGDSFQGRHLASFLCERLKTTEESP